jgi:hypothetical protein
MKTLQEFTVLVERKAAKLLLALGIVTLAACGGGEDVDVDAAAQADKASVAVESEKYVVTDRTTSRPARGIVVSEKGIVVSERYRALTTPTTVSRYKSDDVAAEAVEAQDDSEANTDDNDRR